MDIDITKIDEYDVNIDLKYQFKNLKTLRLSTCILAGKNLEGCYNMKLYIKKLTFKFPENIEKLQIENFKYNIFRFKNLINLKILEFTCD